MAAELSPLVSVITPVYNGEKYLAECIASVLAQTYQNWEYIINNNCSTDNSLAIARRFAEKDARIRINNTCEFVSAEQNHHIAFARMSPESKYCKVVHADDWLFPECIEQMVRLAEANSSVGIVGAYRLDEKDVNLDGLPYPSTIVSGQWICSETLLGNIYVFGSPSSILIRSECIRKRTIFYDTEHFPRHSDHAACYEVLQEWDFGFIHQVLTYTRRPIDSRTSFSLTFASYAVENLKMLKMYGPIFVSRHAYDRCLQEKMRRYYKTLGKSVFQFRNAEFWRYHLAALESLGERLYILKILWVSLFECINSLLCPIEAVQKVCHLVRRLYVQSQADRKREIVPLPKTDKLLTK